MQSSMLMYSGFTDKMCLSTVEFGFRHAQWIGEKFPMPKAFFVQFIFFISATAFSDFPFSAGR